VRRDAASADDSGAEGTPTFFIGGERHLGAWDTETLAAGLEASRGMQDTEPWRPEPDPLGIPLDPKRLG
jgi:hypothetical protein